MSFTFKKEERLRGRSLLWDWYIKGQGNENIDDKAITTPNYFDMSRLSFWKFGSIVFQKYWIHCWAQSNSDWSSCLHLSLKIWLDTAIILRPSTYCENGITIRLEILAKITSLPPYPCLSPSPFLSPSLLLNLSPFLSPIHPSTL